MTPCDYRTKSQEYSRSLREDIKMAVHQVGQHKPRHDCPWQGRLGKVVKVERPNDPRCPSCMERFVKTSDLSMLFGHITLLLETTVGNRDLYVFLTCFQAAGCIKSIFMIPQMSAQNDQMFAWRETNISRYFPSPSGTICENMEVTF